MGKKTQYRRDMDGVVGGQNGWFENGLLECVLEDKNASFMGCWARSRRFTGYLGSKMGAGGGP